MTRFLTRILPLAALGLTLAACDSGDPVAPIDLEVQTATDIAADPGTRDNNTGQVVDTGRFTLYSLRENRVVLSYTTEDRADSLGTAWDIGFRGSDIIVNGGTSGTGTGSGLIVQEAFEAIPTASSLALRADGEGSCPSVETPGGTFPGTPRVVCSGSGNGWYTYVPFPGNQGGYLVPTPGRTLVVRTADGEGYAKVKLRSYYQGNPDPATIDLTTPSRYFTFDFVLNPDGPDFE